MSEKHEKVLLINPPGSGRGSYSSPPLGILYCAGVLQRHNVPVKVVDGCIGGGDAILKKAMEFRPTIIGITCPTYARSKALKTAETLKKAHPETKILFGGAHPTVMGRHLLENYPFIDMVAMGESDFLLPDICNGIGPENIPGLGFRKGAKPVLNAKRPNIEDLDAIPFPAWDLIDARKYLTDDRGIFEGVNLDAEPCAFLVFSRGCVGNCNFCSNKLTWDRWRHRSPKNTADEIELLNKKYGIRHFHFNDDCFSADTEAAIELCDEVTRRKLKIFFDAVTRVDCINEKLLRSMRSAGCYKISFGIETASPRLLKIMHKSVNMDRAVKSIQLTVDSGIQADIFIIAGCIGETWETVNETVDFLNRIRPSRVSVSPGLMVFPGTRLYEHAKKENFIDDDFWLSDYNWKIYTAENSRMQLNIYAEALRRRRKLSRYFVINALRYNKFATKEAEIGFKKLLAAAGLYKKEKKHKHKIAY
ncbi:MAG: radical SAM protein [Candidatus Omnitrophica bacterium]|nr:radical SAM protein [Candidatus Omnitrophota bacterium]